MLRPLATLSLLGLGLLARSPGPGGVAPNVVVACDSLLTRASDMNLGRHIVALVTGHNIAPDVLRRAARMQD